MDILDMELSGVWPLSQGAVSAAREYVSLVEAQLAKAHADMRASALAECEASPDSDEADHQSYVGAVDRAPSSATIDPSCGSRRSSICT